LKSIIRQLHIYQFTATRTTKYSRSRSLHELIISTCRQTVHSKTQFLQCTETIDWWAVFFSVTSICCVDYIHY